MNGQLELMPLQPIDISQNRAQFIISNWRMANIFIGEFGRQSVNVACCTMPATGRFRNTVRADRSGRAPGQPEITMLRARMKLGREPLEVGSLLKLPL